MKKNPKDYKKRVAGKMPKNLGILGLGHRVATPTRAMLGKARIPLTRPVTNTPTRAGDLGGAAKRIQVLTQVLKDKRI